MPAAMPAAIADSRARTEPASVAAATGVSAPTEPASITPDAAMPAPPAPPASTQPVTTIHCLKHAMSGRPLRQQLVVFGRHVLLADPHHVDQPVLHVVGLGERHHLRVVLPEVGHLVTQVRRQRDRVALGATA